MKFEYQLIVGLPSSCPFFKSSSMPVCIIGIKLHVNNKIYLNKKISKSSELQIIGNLTLNLTNSEILIEGFRKFRLQRVAGVKAATECEEQSISVLHNNLFVRIIIINIIINNDDNRHNHHHHYQCCTMLLFVLIIIKSITIILTNTNIIIIINLALSIHYTFFMCLCSGTGQTSIMDRAVFTCENSHIQTETRA